MCSYIRVIYTCDQCDSAFCALQLTALTKKPIDILAWLVFLLKHLYKQDWKSVFKKLYFCIDPNFTLNCPPMAILQQNCAHDYNQRLRVIDMEMSSSNPRVWRTIPIRPPQLSRWWRYRLKLVVREGCTPNLVMTSLPRPGPACNRCGCIGPAPLGARAPRHGVWIDYSFLPDTPCAWEFSRDAI